MTVATISNVSFCVTHGYAHHSDETPIWGDAPDNLYCQEECWQDVVTLDSGEVSTRNTESITEPVSEHVIGAGSFVYLDTRTCGLVPGKVVELVNTGPGVGEATVKVTADRGDWRRGQFVVLRVPNVSLVKRTQVRRVRGRIVVNGRTCFITDEGESL